MRNIIKAALFTPINNSCDRWGLNLLLWGKPGVGKTSIIEGLFVEYGLAYETLSPGERGEGAFGVTPVPMNGVISYPPPDYVSKFENGGALFLDEIGTAAPALQAPIMGIALARRIGGYQLNGRTRVIAAANNSEDGCNPYDLAPPLANRFGHIEWGSLTAEQWSSYMLAGSHPVQLFDAQEEEARVLQNWTEEYAKAKGMVIGFLRKRSGLLHVQPKAEDPNRSKAWPSPRSWESATRALASAAVHNLNEVETDILISAFIGQGAATELGVFIKENDLPDPIAILDGKETFKHNGKRLDRTVALLDTCAALVIPMDSAHRNKRASAMWALMKDIPHLDALVPSAQQLLKNGLGSDIIPAAKPVIHKLHGIINTPSGA